ncbi:UDP-N-acetylmuramate dehydrogenase [Atopomonas sediminilitoris]|uniref:UDP-N-acetylmuramate dehydrogenase n=1 Tax=Atopomonas sediminilitoris TaxID=2919919 RepID=UPI001F4DDF3A|nr:UDP-N-acetylmuramate dehydrogenase [Atopomonas sediminilitoris]MCJ8169124.1 UDP-N-acetylmuramate dehydrogenase [Atopomonas sediminilitoris]
MSQLIVREAFALSALNTFALPAQAAQYCALSDSSQLPEVLAAQQRSGLALFVLGGGSNLLLTQNLDAFVLHMTTQGKRVLSQQADVVLVEAEAGEAWHPFVLWTLSQGFGGLENLSLIPGTVGAAPVQNIGAYGVEINDRLHSLDAWDCQQEQLVTLNAQDCAFAYRDSCFKREPARWIILRVRFALYPAASTPLALEYGPIRQHLSHLDIAQPTPADVSRAVCAIRAEKLPDPRQLANAGSFFKNPLVPAQQALALLAQYPAMPSYPQADGQTKLAAGWLIEQAGWKGYRDGDAGVHANQALVLVNYGSATGAQMKALAQRIQTDIHERFAVALDIEPIVI